MKRTITGFMNRLSLVLDKGELGGFSIIRTEAYDTPVTVNFDDGQPSTRTVYEWITKPKGMKWITVGQLMSEEEAAEYLKGQPYQKLRAFEVEVSE